MSTLSSIRPLLWVGSSKDDLKKMSEEVRADFGYGLHQAQIGQHPDIAEPLNGFGGANVLELKLKEKGEAYRTVYTVKFKDAIVVLHVFHKKK